MLGLNQDGQTADASIEPAFAEYSQTMDPQKAAKLAREQVIEMISNGQGTFAVTSADNAATKQAFFGAYKPGKDVAVVPENINALEKRIEKDQSLLQKEIIGTTEARLNSIARDIRNGNVPSIPNAYFELGRRLNMDPKEILDMQFKAAGLPVPERKPTSVDTMREGTKDPRLLELLQKPTYANQQTVALQNASYTSADPRAHSLITMAQRNGIDPGDLAAIIEMESSFDLNADNGIGYRGLIQAGPTERNTYQLGSGNFEQEVLGIEKFLKARFSSVGRELNGATLEDLYATVLGGNPNVGNVADSNGTYTRSPETAALLQQKRGQALQRLGMTVRSSQTNATRDPNYMSPTLAYITGNIGPTSTGEHLDVKRANGSYFNYSDLDEFVFVDDKDLGRVPLSKVPETDDWEGHTRRGSHGRDYGTYSGTKLYVANGAKVVSNRSTDHGDKVTIKLPDGRMFTFLHGKGV